MWRFPRMVTKVLVALGFRAPGEPSRKELRARIKDVVDEAHSATQEFVRRDEERRSQSPMKPPSEFLV